MSKSLMFERRGCEFFEGDKARVESDIGNYRITTPGEIVPGKDGKMYCLEFENYDRYDTRTTAKKTGKKLKHPVRELTMTNAARIDTQYTDYSETQYGLSYCNLDMERDFYATPRKYTEKNILDYVNSISSEHYDAIIYVESFSFDIEAGKDFTPARKIYDWAKKNNLRTENTLDGIRVYLYTGIYKYHCYNIEQSENGEHVTIYLERVADCEA